MSTKLSIAQKLQILDMLEEPRATQSSVAKEFGVSRKTIQNTIANRNLLKERAGYGLNRKRCHLRIEQKFDDVNDAVYQWFMRMREKHGDIPLVESVICRKAMGFATVLGKVDFKASKGWFTCWKDRCGLSVYKVSLW